MKRLLVSLLLTGLALAANSQHPIQGASVTGVQLDNGTATITVSNLSKHDISGYTIGITAVTADGRKIYSERTEDYGPSAHTHKALHSGETSEQIIGYGRRKIQTVNAAVIVAIYDDQTAEVTNERAFQTTINDRRRIATALQQSAIAFKNAASDATPRERAKHDFDDLLKSADANKANGEFLRSSASVAASAPPDKEREFMQAQADRFQQEADLFVQHANIRRLP